MRLHLKKRVLSVFLACLLTAGTGAALPTKSGQVPAVTICAAAEDTLPYVEGKADALSYYKYETSVTIVGCDPEAETVDIPEKIGGVPVTAIGDEAFRGCKLTAVTLPETMVTIGFRAFMECENLQSVTIPSMVSQIDNSAFEKCTSLETVDIKPGLILLGTEVFKDSGLRSITIPSTVSYFGFSIFDGTPWWEEKIAADPLVIFNGIVVDGRNCKGDVVIPEGVESISRFAFEESKLTSVKFPDSLTEIGAEAFTFCANLQSIELPENLEVIPTGCFSYTGLRSVKLPDGLKRIENNGFMGCSNLTEITFPENLLEIKGNAFEDTPWLEAMREKDPLVIVNATLIDGKTAKGDVVVPDDVSYISPGAFSLNYDLTSIVIPAGVSEIWEETFYYCENLKHVTIGGAYFIGSDAFNGCFHVESFELPASLIQINDMAFHGWSGRIPITYHGTKSMWKKVYIGDGNVSLKIADMTYAPYGDADADGELTVKDIVCLHKWIHNQPKNQIKNPDVVDINQDGTWDVFDLSLLKQAILKG